MSRLQGCRAANANAWSNCSSHWRPDVTLLLIEHDMDVALRVASRVVVMADGQTIAAGTPDEIRRSAIVRDVYLGKKRRMSDHLLARS